MNNKMKCALFAVIVAGAMLPSAHADTVTVTLTPAIETGTAGDTVTYSATISAPATNAAPLYLNDESIDFNGLTAATTDGTDLFLNFPVDLNPGNSASGDLFTVMLPADAAPGSYTGDFILDGGADLSTYDTLATVSFTLDIPAAVSPVPEPSTWTLLAAGLLSIAGLRWRQRSTQL